MAASCIEEAPKTAVCRMLAPISRSVLAPPTNSFSAPEQHAFSYHARLLPFALGRGVITAIALVEPGLECGAEYGNYKPDGYASSTTVGWMLV